MYPFKPSESPKIDNSGIIMPRWFGLTELET